MAPAELGSSEITELFKTAGELCSIKMPVYLIGGGAMIFRREKLSTKDVDLVLLTDGHAKELEAVFTKMGMLVNSRLAVELQITSKDSQRPWVDIFVGRVCDGLSLTESMRQRSEHVANYGNISLYMLSREDIFLLKSITDRLRDLEEMLVLYSNGLDERPLFTECEIQDGLQPFDEPRIWEAYLLVRLNELEKRFSIRIGWKNELARIAEMKTGAALVLIAISKGFDTVDKVSKYNGITEREVRRYAGQLERDV